VRHRSLQVDHRQKTVVWSSEDDLDDFAGVPVSTREDLVERVLYGTKSSSEIFHSCYDLSENLSALPRMS
jgi:hypothetical protein